MFKGGCKCNQNKNITSAVNNPKLHFMGICYYKEPWGKKLFFIVGFKHKKAEVLENYLLTLSGMYSYKRQQLIISVKGEKSLDRE